MIMDRTIGLMGGFALMAGCATTGLQARNQAALAPAFVLQMADYIQEKNRRIRDNLPDCAKTYVAVVGHIGENVERIRQIAEAMQAVDENAAEEEKRVAAQQVMSHLLPLFHETMDVQREYARLCPLEYEETGRVLMELRARGRLQAKRTSRAGSQAP